MTSDEPEGRRSTVGRHGDDRDALVVVLVKALRYADGVHAELGLGRVSTFADFRAAVPLMDRPTHAERIESKLGFGLAPKPANLLDTQARPTVVARWRAALERVRAPPLRSIVRFGRHPIRRVDALLEDDLLALAPDAELLTIAESMEPSEAVARLVAAAPELLVVPSATAVGWLERELRKPLERGIPSLWALMAEHDHGTSIRSGLPLVHTGRFSPAGRIGLPGPRAEAPGWTMADTCLLELLAEGDPDEISRGRSRLVAPERANLGRRYELVISSPAGVVRMRSGIDVRVTGFETRASRGLPRVTPQVVDIPPPPRDLPLEGVTLPGSWVTAAIRQAFRAEDPALVDARAIPDERDPGASTSPRGRSADSDVFDGTELAGALDAAGARPVRGTRIVVHLEVQGPADTRFAEGLAARVDEALRKRSGAYEFLRGRGDLHRPRVVLRPSGSARSRRDERIRRMHGRVDQPPIRVGQPELEL